MRLRAGSRSLPRQRNRLARFCANSLALLADFAANLAVLMLARVLSTFFAAKPACLSAGVQHGLQYDLVATRAPRSERPGRAADVGAVEIQSYALRELLDHFLAQASVCACCADLGAVVASVNATDERIICVSTDVRMCADDFLRVHELAPFACCSDLLGRFRYEVGFASFGPSARNNERFAPY